MAQAKSKAQYKRAYKAQLAELSNIIFNLDDDEYDLYKVHTKGLEKLIEKAAARLDLPEV